MRSYVLIFISLLLTVCVDSCNGRGDLSAGYDTSDIIIVDTTGLYYEVPHIESSVIATPDQLPEQIAMCVLDTQTNVSVMLLNLVTHVTDSLGARRTVDMITSQGRKVDCLILEDKIRHTHFMNQLAWNFRHVISFFNRVDTVNVTFYGYVFGNHALVVTKDTTDCDQFFDQYVQGLKRF